MTGGLLEVHEVVKDYPAPNGAVRVLAGVSFLMERGQSLAIMGPSGSGKSTLLNILGILDSPTKGRVLMEGRDIHSLGPKEAAEFRNKRIGFVFQEHHLLPQCTALENVLMPCLAAGKVKPEDVERGRKLLEAVGLSGKEDRFPGEISGGERQRVAIARSMMNRPAVLLCDEPTGDLDADTGMVVARLFLELCEKENSAVVLVTHNEAITELFGRRGTLKEGRIHE